MKVMKACIFTFFLSILFTVPALATTATPSYIPKVNKAYSFQTTFPSNSGYKAKDTITFVPVQSGMVKGTEAGDAGGDVHFWSQNSQVGLYWLMGSRNAVSKTTDAVSLLKANKGEVVLKYPVSKGLKWTGKAQIVWEEEPELISYASQIVSTTETVKTSYKTFTNAIKVKTIYNNDSSLYLYRYFAKDVGLIKEEYCTKDENGKFIKIMEVALIGIK